MKLPKVFTDHMVLQRNKEVVVWRTADTEQEVTALFRGELTADHLGKRAP